MAGAWGEGRRHVPAAAAAALVATTLALAAATLLAPSSPSYDPFAWVVWGRELMPGAGGPPFGLAGGPSWKPLPVLFTGPFALAGGAAPALWLMVARAGLLLAVAGAFALATRLAGRWAGLVAALALLLLADVVSLAWRGASEPLMAAAVLWAAERHLAGARRSAFALGVAAALIRPEAAPFLLLYALALGREAGARDRLLLLAGLALVPLLWIGVPAVGGDPLAAARTATHSARTTPADPAGTALDRGLALAPALVWALALAAVALRPRDRAVGALAIGAAAWLALVVAMAGAGYAGVARYMLPAAAVACVLAGAGAVEVGRRLAARMRATRDATSARRVLATAVAVVLLAAGGAAAAQRSGTLPGQVREGVAVARAHDALRTAIARAGGAAALRRCAVGGWVAVNHTTQSALAWELRVGLDRVALTLSRPGLLVRAPRSTATGAPPAIALAPPLHTVERARAGPWTVLAVRSAQRSLPPACAARKASGAPRRIPNI